MTIKALIKILQTYNQAAEVRVLTDRDKGGTAPATLITELEEKPRNRFGFGAVLNKAAEEKKKRASKVVIG